MAEQVPSKHRVGVRFPLLAKIFRKEKTPPVKLGLLPSLPGLQPRFS